MNVTVDVPVLIALAGAGIYLLVTVILGRYAATHYTRKPGSGWTTWA